MCCSLLVLVLESVVVFPVHFDPFRSSYMMDCDSPDCGHRTTSYDDIDWCSMEPIQPKLYECKWIPRAIALSGRIDDPLWETASWSDYFQDIEGNKKPAPRFNTRMKMLWDGKFVYIAAHMEEPSVIATLTEENSIIFHDNDFEIFIDPDGDNHNYYEFEVNALNTIWELTLKRPYKDGGPAIHGTNLRMLKSMVYVDGQLNDPDVVDNGWSVEVAIPIDEIQQLFSHDSSLAPTAWRINFSRVQWEYKFADGRPVKVRDKEDNWVWSPQGIIDMHRPEMWGVVVFRQPNGTTPVPLCADHWPVRKALLKVYHRQKRYYDRHSERYATSLEALGLSPTVRVTNWSGAECSVSLSLHTSAMVDAGEASDSNSDGFICYGGDNDGACSMSIDHESKLLTLPARQA